jgi:hypothetical protein
MITIKATNDGMESLIGHALRSLVASGDIVAGLCFPPGATSNSSTLLEVLAHEADFPGYARQPLTNPGPVTVAEDAAAFLCDPVTFTAQPTATPADVRSVFLYSSTLDEVLFVSDALPEQFSTIAPGASLRLDVGFLMSRIEGVL